MVTVTVPATSANVGAGFDSLGLAVSMHNVFTFEESDRIQISSVDGTHVPAGSNNLVYRSARVVYDQLGIPLKGLRITQRNDIPMARGLGSSSACIVAGIMGANALLGDKLTERQMLTLATAIEGHPDNVAPAMLGGFVTSVIDEGQVYSVKTDIDPELAFAAFVPDFRLLTSKARAALPAMVSHKDAVYNLSRAALAESIGFGLDRPYALVTYHPETAGGASPAAQFDALCAALERCGLAAVFTKANADAGGADINARIDAVCAARPGQYIAFTSMGVLRYLSAMKYCAVVAGNSSSGVVETPSLGVPCVNVGDRQKGRLLSANIICCAADEASVYAALQKALSPAFAAQARQAKSPYNGGDTSGRIVRRLEAFVQSPSLGKPKLFYDGPVPGWEKEGSR